MTGPDTGELPSRGHHDGPGVPVDGGGRARRLFVIGSLYLVTNISFAFFFLTLATILLGRGVPMGTVAVINLLGLIYFGRFLCAPIVDRFGIGRRGHYRGWLIATQLALLVALLGMSLIDPVANMALLIPCMSVILVLSVFHDTALSGLAVRLLPPADRGLANGIQIACGSASMLIGSGGALLIYANAGWTTTLLVLGAVFLLPLAVLVRLTEPAPRTETRKSVLLQELVSFARSRRLVTWALLVIPLFAIGEWLATAPQSAMLLSAGWPMERIATVQSIASGVQIVAALVTGFAISRYGRARSAVVVAALGVLAVAALFPLAMGTAPVAPTAVVLVFVSIVYGSKLTVIATVSMDLARDSSAATDYTVPMSVEGMFVTVVSSAGLALAGAVGFGWLIATACVVGVVGLAVGPWWIRRHAAGAAVSEASSPQPSRV